MGFFKFDTPRQFHLPGYKQSRVFDNEAREKEHWVHFKRQVSSRAGLFSLSTMIFLLIVVVFLIWAFSR